MSSKTKNILGEKCWKLIFRISNNSFHYSVENQNIYSKLLDCNNTKFNYCVLGQGIKLLEIFLQPDTRNYIIAFATRVIIASHGRYLRDTGGFCERRLIVLDKK